MSYVRKLMSFKCKTPCQVLQRFEIPQHFASLSEIVGCEFILSRRFNRFLTFVFLCMFAFSALTRLGGRKGIRPVKNEWWGAGVVICLERCADLHMAQLMPLPLTVSCFSKIQIGFTSLVPAHPGSPGKGTVKCVCVCVCVCVYLV